MDVVGNGDGGFEVREFGRLYEYAFQALFAGMGVMAAVGHYFLTIAYGQAPAAVVAPA